MAPYFEHVIYISKQSVLNVTQNVYYIIYTLCVKGYSKTSHLIVSSKYVDCQSDGPLTFA